MSAPTPIWKPSSPGLIEQPESGRIVLGETATLVKIYRGKYADCFAGALPRGTIGASGITTGLIVQNSEVQPERGASRLIINWGGFSDTGSGAVLPADEFDLEPVELNPAVEKNSAFADLYPDSPGTTVLKMQNYVTDATQGADASARKDAYDKLVAISSSDARDQAFYLIHLLKRGVTSFYMAGFRYSWTSYYLTTPGITRGGFRSSPGGPLSSAIASLSLSCLREADRLGNASNGYYRYTRTWLCGPAGHWDAVLYP